MLLFAATVLTIILGGDSVGLVTEIPLDRFVPEVGDALVVNTRENIGYLIHSDGVFTSFPAATGQRRVVRYIGRTYDATTPEREWVVSSLEYKLYDRVTYGPTGRFLRLSSGGERTSYGIHGHRDAATMLAENLRFRSMGCIIVSEEALDLLEREFALNGNAFRVVTQYGLDRASALGQRT